jgi:hypothetical protein
MQRSTRERRIACLRVDGGWRRAVCAERARCGTPLALSLWVLGQGETLLGSSLSCNGTRKRRRRGDTHTHINDRRTHQMWPPFFATTAAFLVTLLSFHSDCFCLLSTQHDSVVLEPPGKRQQHRSLVSDLDHARCQARCRGPAAGQGCGSRCDAPCAGAQVCVSSVVVSKVLAQMPGRALQGSCARESATREIRPKL